MSFCTQFVHVSCIHIDTKYILQVLVTKKIIFFLPREVYFNAKRKIDKNKSVTQGKLKFIE